MKKVLIVDDDQGIIEALTTLLEFSGYQPIIPNFKKFIDSVRQEKPHLVLLDLKLKGFDSQDLFTKMRYDKDLQKIPVIIVSADSNTQEIADQMGADAFVEKPFDMDMLLETIERLT